MSASSDASSVSIGHTVRLGTFELALPPVHALAVPIMIVLMLAMMIVPLPAMVLDLLFTFNIAVALVVLLVSAYTVRALDFAVFPAVLLITTLMRLSLNVASTRVVLLHGHNGTDAAGQVIEAFANFVIAGNFGVGIIVFAILTVINFVVVTKGAGRIAEVSARFALDAMPGKQMAIDADLNAGLIDQDEARRRRSEVAHEADFFGSMDGASKFVRGDAVAGMMILGINVIGGFAVGILQHDLTLAKAANNYVLLAIGDALVAQVPSLVISIAAGLIVSRVGNEEDVGKQVVRQLFGAPRALGLTAAVVGLLGVVPGMPHVAFFMLAGVCAYLAWRLSRPAPVEEAPAAPAESSSTDATWEDVTPVDVLGLEVGYKLIALVDQGQGAELMGRIKGVRKKFAQEVGFLPPAVHIRDNLELRPTVYRITLRGAVVGEAEAFPGMWLAIDPGRVLHALPGPQTRDPAFGLPAVWIDAKARESAQVAGYTVVDAATVIATHLHHLMQVHAARLLGRAETQQLVEHIGRFAPKLVEEVIPKLVPLSALQRVLQNLLEEAVNVRDLRGILEVVGECAARTQDPAELTAEIRRALAPAMVQQIFGPVSELNVIALEPGLESLLVQALAQDGGPALEPGVGDFVTRSAASAATQQEEAGHAACLLVPDKIRPGIARLVRKAAPRLRVLGHGEIPDSHEIRIGHIIGEQS